MPLTPATLLVALTEARQQVVGRLNQARAANGAGAVGTLRSAVIAVAALEVVKAYPEAVQLVLNRAQEMLEPYEQEAGRARSEARATLASAGGPDPAPRPGGR